MAGLDQIVWLQVRPRAVIELLHLQGIGGAKNILVHICLLLISNGAAHRNQELAFLSGIADGHHFSLVPIWLVSGVSSRLT